MVLLSMVLVLQTICKIQTISAFVTQDIDTMVSPLVDNVKLLVLACTGII